MNSIWIQWPSPYEPELIEDYTTLIQELSSASSPASAPIHLLTASAEEQRQAIQHLKQQNISLKNLLWHILPIDSSWLANNGPIFLNKNGSLLLTDWGYNNLAHQDGVPFDRDNEIPLHMGKILHLPTEDNTNYILESGNIETNGQGVGLLNWDAQHKRNPTLSQEEQEKILRHKLGLQKIIWAFGLDPRDPSNGQISNIARFVDPQTIFIYQNKTHTSLTLQAMLQNEGFTTVWYPAPTTWFLTNDTILHPSITIPENAHNAEILLQTFYADHAIKFIETPAIIEKGHSLKDALLRQPSLSDAERHLNSLSLIQQ